MQLIFKFVIAILVVIGLGAIGFFGLVMKDDTAPSTKQLIESSRELLQLDNKDDSSSTITAVPRQPIITEEPSAPPITRPITTLNIPSKTQESSQASITTETKLTKNADATAVSAQQSIDARRIKLQKLAKIQTDLQRALTQNPAEMNMESVDQALSELAAMGDADGVVGGVNINALRQTITAAAKLNLLGQEIQAYSSNPGGTDPEKMMEYIEQVQALQSTIITRSNSLVPNQERP